MRIGIIGDGNMGAALAAGLTRPGHQVAIANSRGPATLGGVAARTGATPVPITQVTGNADAVIAAIPQKNIPELPAGLLSALPWGHGPHRRRPARKPMGASTAPPPGG
jgi:predicted dinucleotide-binding enzyme